MNQPDIVKKLGEAEVLAAADKAGRVVVLPGGGQFQEVKQNGN